MIYKTYLQVLATFSHDHQSCEGTRRSVARAFVSPCKGFCRQLAKPSIDAFHRVFVDVEMRLRPNTRSAMTEDYNYRARSGLNVGWTKTSCETCAGGLASVQHLAEGGVVQKHNTRIISSSGVDLMTQGAAQTFSGTILICSVG